MKRKNKTLLVLALLVPAVLIAVMAFASDTYYQTWVKTVNLKARNVTVDDDITIAGDVTITGATTFGTAVKPPTETISAAAVLKGYGTSVLAQAASSTATLGNGVNIGELKTMVQTTTATTTMTVTNHVTSDPEVFVFDAVDEYLLLIWTGTEWATVAGSATAP